MNEEAQDFYQHEPVGPSEAPAQPPSAISWTASEFLNHQKGGSWYAAVVLGILAFSVLLYLIIRDIFSSVAVVILGGLLVVVAGRKPRVLEYRVDEAGVYVGTKHYAYDDFLSFYVNQEDQIESLVLMPQKRFAPEISLYFAPEEGQRIFDVISSYLPYEQRNRDMLDRLLHKIRF